MKANKFYINTIFWLRCGLIALLIQGCSSFEQDFTRSPLNEVIIDVEQSEYDAVQLENVHIPVNISTTDGKAGRYSYQWKAITNDAVYVLSDQKDLDIVIDIPPKQYNVQYIVTDLDNGMQYQKHLFLQVNGKYYEGWFVSHNKNNKGKLAFVRVDNTVFPNPIGEDNNFSFTQNLKASFYTEIPYNAEYASVACFTGTEIFRFDPNNFKLTGKSEEVFVSPSGYDGLAWDSGIAGIDQYFVNRGELHAGMGGFTPTDILKPYTLGFGGDYDLFPAVISSSYTRTFFYDNKYKRFLVAPAFERNLSIASNGSNSTLSIFNMSNVGKTMIAAEKGRSDLYSRVFYFVMEDNEGRYVMAINDGEPSLSKKVLDSACPDFSKAKLFAASGIFQHLFYVVDNKIYRFNIVANTAELLYSFPESEVITDIEIKQKTSRTLAVATWNGTSGNLNLFTIDDFGRFVNDAPAKVFNDFGNIVHISNR